jgi:hypothetical protein
MARNPELIRQPTTQPCNKVVDVGEYSSLLTLAALCLGEETCNRSVVDSHRLPEHDQQVLLLFRQGTRSWLVAQIVFNLVPHAPLKEPFYDLTESWADIPGWRTLADELKEPTEAFHRLGAAQLPRHVLGLKFGTSPEKVRLLYLYYDALGDEAEEHRREIARFAMKVASDPIRFVPMAGQEIILRAIRLLGAEHREYVEYLSERYL